MLAPVASSHTSNRGLLPTLAVHPSHWRLRHPSRALFSDGSPTMFSGVPRLARVASALAHRRHYVVAVLRGGDGAKPITFKLSLPWKKAPLLKPCGEAANPILRVLSPSASSCKDHSRVTITLAENSGVIASVELLPKTPEAMVDMSEDEEKEAMASTEEDEDEEFWVYTSSEDEDEEDEIYPAMEESSGDALMMDLFYKGGAAERAMEEAESKYTVPDRKCSGIRRPPSSFLMDFSYWPHDSFASAVVLQTDEQGDCIWQSSWSFNVETDSVNENISDPRDVQGPIVALSQYHDQRLEYTGVICGSILEKFKISFDTHYEVKELLGAGAEGEVHRCVSLDNSHSCAIKCSASEHVDEEPRESMTMRMLCHPHVRRIYSAWAEDKPDTGAKEYPVFLAQEFFKCTLEDYLDENPVKSICDRVKIFTQAVSGLRYLHSKGIVHRDIKPNNIFLDDHGDAKIGDFGHSGLISSESCSHGGKLYGTRLYGSPELLLMQKHGVKSDVFSLGMVYAELFGPSAAAAERAEWLLKLRILVLSPQWKKYPFSTWRNSELSKDWTGDASLMKIMLEPSPEERPSCEDILDLL